MHKMAWWLKWHRRLGLVVAVLVVMLVVTGILINHSQSMGWHHKPVFSHWLARLYQIPPSVASQGYPVSDHWIAQLDNTIFLDDVPLVSCSDPLLGALQLSDLMAVVCGDSLWLFESSGELVEQVRGVPANGLQLGTDAGLVLVKTAAGIAAYDDDQGGWQEQALTESILWLTPRLLPSSLANKLTQQAPIPGLNRERVLLDIHSGRILGDLGVWIVDGAAVVMLILACSGFLTWYGRYRKRSKRNPR